MPTLSNFLTNTAEGIPINANRGFPSAMSFAAFSEPLALVSKYPNGIDFFSSIEDNSDAAGICNEAIANKTSKLERRW